MTILKTGAPPAHRQRKCTCSSCRCEFLFEECEAQFILDGRDGDYFSVKCPQTGCSQMNSVSVHVAIENRPS